MSDWRWTFKIKTGEIITIYTEDNNPPSKTKAIAELARACCGGEGRSEETLLKIGYALQPELVNPSPEKQIPVTTAPLPVSPDATLFSQP